MEITFKLFASLGDYLPASVRPGNEMNLPVPDGATIAFVVYTVVGSLLMLASIVAYGLHEGTFDLTQLPQSSSTSRASAARTTSTSRSTCFCTVSVDLATRSS